jgi:hypothetical protein
LKRVAVASAALQAAIVAALSDVRPLTFRRNISVLKCAIVFALIAQNVSITPMKVVLLILALPVLMCIAGCTSDSSDPGARSSFGGPPAMSGSDSNASENRY